MKAMSRARHFWSTSERNYMMHDVHVVDVVPKQTPGSGPIATLSTR